MEITQTDTPEKAAGTSISSILKARQDQPVLLLLSGGSALKVLEHIDPASLYKNTTVLMADDRFTDDSEHNNFLQLKETNFFQAATDRGVTFVDTVPERESDTPESFATGIHKTLSYYVDIHPDAYVIGLFGVGNDGHTASIFPDNSEAAFRSKYFNDELYMASKNPAGPITDRITITPYFIKHHLDEILIYAAGASKKLILEQLSNPDTKAHQLPAKLLTEKGKVTLFTDQEL